MTRCRSLAERIATAILRAYNIANVPGTQKGHAAATEVAEVEIRRLARKVKRPTDEWLSEEDPT